MKSKAWHVGTKKTHFKQRGKIFFVFLMVVLIVGGGIIGTYAKTVQSEQNGLYTVAGRAVIADEGLLMSLEYFEGLVKMYYANSPDEALVIKKFLMGEGPITKDIIMSFLSRVEKKNALKLDIKWTRLTEPEKIHLLSTQTLANLIVGIVGLHENASAFCNSEDAVRKTVSAMKCLQSFLTVIGKGDLLPPQISIVLTSIECVMPLADYLMMQEVKQWLQVYEVELMIAESLGNELPLPSYNSGLPQKYQDAYYQLYMQYYLKRLISAIPNSDSTIPNPDSTIPNPDEDVSGSYSTGLEFVSNGDGTCYVSGIGSCKDTDISIPSTSPSGDRVTRIGHSAFKYRESLTSIIIPAGVTSIDHYAFAFCSRLTSIAIPDSVTSIGDYAFRRCSNLTSITIPAGVTSIGDSAFYDCDQLEQEEKGVYYVDRWVVGSNSNAIDVVLRSNTVGIGKYAFNNRASLTSITIPDSVTSIGDFAFAHCSNLTSIVIPKSVTSIGDHVFSRCGRLESIVIPEGVTSIGYGAFEYCRRLTSLVIPKSVTEISFEVFYECENLTSIVIPNSVTYMGLMVFGNCFNLKNIYYFGSRNEWKAIFSSYGNNYMWNTTIHYLGELEEVTVYPTCTDKGYTYFKCNCGKTHNYSENNPLGHDKVSHEAKDPTCTDIGWNAYETCSRCDYTNYKEIPACGHTYTAYAYNSTLHWLACKNCGKKPETAGNEPHKLTWTVVDNTNEDENKLSCTLRAECKCGYGSEEPFITGTAKITGVSLALGEKLTLKYYAILPADDMNVVMRFTYEGETYDVRGIKDTGTGEYVFSFDRIPPSKMDVAVKAELVLTQNDTETILAVKEEYSISEYCEDAKEANPEDEALNLLLDDLETYNKAAEDYENGISKDPSDVDWEPLTDTDFSLSESTDETVRFKAAGVRFGFVNRLFFKFTAEDLNGLTVKVNDTLYTAADFALVEGTENTYIIYSKGIYATEFDKVFEVVLAVNGEKIQTLKYSVKSYVKAKQDDPEMGALVRALYNYGKSSELYRDEM